jgi:hypothetical protein
VEEVLVVDKLLHYEEIELELNVEQLREKKKQRTRKKKAHAVVDSRNLVVEVVDCKVEVR